MLGFQIKCIFATAKKRILNFYKVLIVMTKADIVNEIAKKTGVEKTQIQTIVEAFMEEVKISLEKEENV